MTTAPDHGYPLSPQQRRLWQLSAIAGDPLVSRLTLAPAAAVDERRLERAAEALVARHEALRTAFVVPRHGRWPLQVVREAAGCDFRGGEGGPHPAEGPFDVASGEGLRLRLTRDGARTPRVTLAASALVADLPSLTVLAGELAVFYDGGVPKGEPVQYADFAAWQEEQLAAEGGDPGRLWARCLRMLDSPPRLPLEASAAAVDAAPAAAIVCRADDALRALAAASGAAVADVALAAWSLLLWRLTGRDDLTLGVVFAGRPFADLAGAVGPYAKVLPLDLPPADRLDFAALVERMATARHDLGEIEALVGADRLEGRVLPFGFSHHRLPAAPGWGVAGAAGAADLFTVHLVCHEKDAGIELAIEHDAGRVGAVEAGLLGERLERLIEDAAVDPGRPLVGFRVVGRREERRLIVELNATDRPPGEPRLDAALRRRAAERPEAVALASGTVHLTYVELVRRADRGAAVLAGLGVGRGQVVAIGLERGPEMVVATLAVLAAGAAWLPLDPEHPPARLALMLEDCGAVALVTTSSLAAALPAAALPPTLLLLDRDEAAAGSLAGIPPSPDVEGDDLAYVLYTSGSTGVPKGVMMPHRGIANRLAWMARALPLTVGDRVAVKTPAGFDASIWELFAPLDAGACAVLAPADAHRDPAALVAWAARQGVTVLQLVPSLLGPVLDRIEAGAALPALRRLFCGGEALPTPVALRAAALLGVEVHNLYGPTETAIDASHHGGGAAGGRTVPIGRPLDNVRIHLLDDAGAPVPTGVAGDLYVAGAGLARGYLGRPARTAESFVPDPFATRPGGRLYRTGDRARRLADGTLEFLGRRDGQIKLRGVRFELGEIESVLTDHPAVSVAAAAVRGGEEGGEPRLVAWFVAAGTAGEEELRGWLAARLPAAMVPARVVELDELPRTASGKLDRARLPEPPAADGRRGGALRTVEEELLAGIWCEVLGVDSVGPDDDFFALGGHSLLATQVASRARQALGVEVPLRTLLTHPRLGEVAAEVRRARLSADAIPPLAPSPRDVAGMPLSFAQQRLWFLQRMEPESAAFNVPLAVRLRGDLDLEAVRGSFVEIHRRHEVLRTTFHEVDGRPVQRVEREPSFAMTLEELGAAADPERELAKRLEAELARPFDLGAGPLQRVTLYRLAPSEHVVLLVTHHIACDAWSTAILVRELAALYPALHDGRSAPLPELPLQYADFAAWQRAWLAGERLESEIEHWRRRLAGAPPVLDLPSAGPRPQRASGRGRSHGHVLPAELSAALRALARREGATLFMVVMAGFHALLHAATGREDLVVGTDIANRTRVETEPLIGFFINQLAIRARMTGDDTFRDLLARVREESLEAFAHQDLPFDKVVEALRPPRSLAHAPLFQVKLNLQNVPPSTLGVDDLSLAPVELRSEVSQLDLVVSLVDGRDNLFGSIQYSADLFDEAAIDELWRDYQVVLETVAGEPAARLAAVARRRAEAAGERRRDREREAEGAAVHRLRQVRRRAAGAA